MEKQPKTSKKIHGSDLSVEDITDALVSVDGSLALAANILNTDIRQLIFRVQAEPTLLDLICDLKELEIPERKTTGISFEQKENVLSVARMTGLKPREIEEITGINVGVQRRWLDSDPWFREQWSAIREGFGERFLKVIHTHALELKDWKAALEVLRSEYPEHGYVRNTQKAAEVTVNLTHEGMLDALEQFNSAKSDPTSVHAEDES